MSHRTAALHLHLLPTRLLHHYRVTVAFATLAVFVERSMHLDQTDILAMIHFSPNLRQILVDLVHFLTVEIGNRHLHCLAVHLKVVVSCLPAIQLHLCYQIFVLNRPGLLLECDVCLKVDLLLQSSVLQVSLFLLSLVGSSCLQLCLNFSQFIHYTCMFLNKSAMLCLNLICLYRGNPQLSLQS